MGKFREKLKKLRRRDKGTRNILAEEPAVPARFPLTVPAPIIDSLSAVLHDSQHQAVVNEDSNSPKENNSLQKPENLIPTPLPVAVEAPVEALQSNVRLPSQHQAVVPKETVSPKEDRSQQREESKSPGSLPPSCNEVTASGNILIDLNDSQPVQQENKENEVIELERFSLMSMTALSTAFSFFAKLTTLQELPGHTPFSYLGPTTQLSPPFTDSSPPSLLRRRLSRLLPDLSKAPLPPQPLLNNTRSQ
jgi:hypothetical protein